MSQSEDDEEAGTRLCHNCVGEEYLSEAIRTGGRLGACEYCGDDAPSLPIAEVADWIEGAFEQHFVRTSDQPDSWQISLLSDRESDYSWERNGEPVVYAIMNAAEIPEAAASDIQEILADRHGDFDSAAMGEETEFDSDSHYMEKGADDRLWQEEWRAFERSLKTEARFFSRSAAVHLSAVFDGVETMESADGRPLVVEAGPGSPFSCLFRARVFQSDDKLAEALGAADRLLGSPAASVAAAGRMNARGISVFYGSNDPAVAIAEVRPTVGSRVAVAKFNIIRPLKLLDLTAVTEAQALGSIFDGSTAVRMERAAFLRSLGRRIVRPVMPDDEGFDYLATQAIADFLATEARSPVDGIIFPSVQIPGAVLNVVLFHKAARVEAISLPPGSTVSVRTGEMTEDGWEQSYTVVEEVPPPSPSSEPEPEDFLGPDFARYLRSATAPYDEDPRDPALRIDLDSLRIHYVTGVQFQTVESCVLRHRTEKRPPRIRRPGAEGEAIDFDDPEF